MTLAPQPRRRHSFLKPDDHDERNVLGGNPSWPSWSSCFRIKYLLPLWVLLFLTLTATLSYAGSLPSERLKDPVQEARAVAIFTQLRCLVCQNETIADSDARIAQDLRLLVRTQIKKGDSDKAILDFIHGRYGDFVLMKPPLNYATWALWFSPLMLLLIGIMIVAGILHRNKMKPAP